MTESTVLREMDDLLDDALQDSSEDEPNPTPLKKVRLSEVILLSYLMYQLF